MVIISTFCLFQMRPECFLDKQLEGFETQPWLTHRLSCSSISRPRLPLYNPYNSRIHRHLLQRVGANEHKRLVTKQILPYRPQERRNIKQAQKILCPIKHQKQQHQLPLATGLSVHFSALVKNKQFPMGTKRFNCAVTTETISLWIYFMTKKENE